MKKLFFIFAMCAALSLVKTPSSAESNIPLTGDEFLTRLPDTMYYVQNGLDHSQLIDAQRINGQIVLSYNSSVFLTIQETTPPLEIKNISVILMAQEEDIDRTARRGKTSPTDNIVFENICMQVMYNLHPQIKKEEIEKLIKGLGFGGELLDGIQRSVSFEYCKYIIKYNSNGMLIMVVSSL